MGKRTRTQPHTVGRNVSVSTASPLLPPGARPVPGGYLVPDPLSTDGQRFVPTANAASAEVGAGGGSAVRPLRFMVMRDDNEPSGPCTPCETLERLAAVGGLPHFLKAFGAPSHEGLGDCHEVTLALMTDLVVAHRSDGWSLVQGTVDFGTDKGADHSWLEYDGWALDVANGKILAIPTARFYTMIAARNVTARNARQVRELVSREAR